MAYSKGPCRLRPAGLTDGTGHRNAPRFFPERWMFFMLIRTAVPADAVALAEVEALCFPAAEAAPEQQFRDRLQLMPDTFG